MQTGINIASIKRIKPAVTISAAIPLGRFFDNLSTIGFKEQAMTKEAKNIIAISSHIPSLAQI